MVNLRELTNEEIANLSNKVLDLRQFVDDLFMKVDLKSMESLILWDCILILEELRKKTKELEEVRKDEDCTTNVRCFYSLL